MDYVIETDKFNRIIFKKVFLRKLNKKEQTIRALLTYYLSLACKDYYNEAMLDLKLNQNYDSRFYVNVDSFGSYSTFVYTLESVDPKYINDPKYTVKGLEELFIKLMEPVIKDNNFDNKLFKRAKELYETDLLDKMASDSYISYNNAIHLFFNGTNRDFDKSGDLETLNKITKKQLYNYYMKMINDESISYVAGDVKGKINELNLATIKPHYNHFFKKRGKYNYLNIEKPDSEQAYLNIIFDIKIFTNSKLFYAAQFLNYIFGSSNSSKLFEIVRERDGFCYSIYSNYYGASGIIFLRSKIYKNQLNEVIASINEAIDKVLDDINLDNIKSYFKDLEYEDLDSMESLITEDFTANYFPQVPSKNKIELIDKVTMKDLKEVKKRLHIDFIYVYGGK